LLPLYYQNGEYYILFTRRTELVRHHKGEISFPGGGYHAEDGSLRKTAIRESYEEIGLAPEDVEILGELDETPTRGSDYTITPFVGSICADYHFKLSDFEIAEIMRIPVKALLKDGCRREEPVIVISNRQFTSYVYAYNSNLIIGATARILKQFLDIFTGVAGNI
jgi:8-oxo-dGTP pyrophosphatase MutT (NUDIX family)